MAPFENDLNIYMQKKVFVNDVRERKKKPTRDLVANLYTHENNRLSRN